MKESTLRYHERLESIFFPVLKVPTNDLFPGTHFASNLTHAIYIPEKDKTVHICPGSYHLIDNEHLIIPITDKLNQVFGPEGYQTIVRSYDDRKFYVTFTVNKALYQVMGDDTVCPSIEIRNSYDGTLKQSASLSFHRLLCKNGMMGFSHEYSMSKKHTLDEGSLELEPMFKDLEKIEKRIKRFKRMSERRVTPHELDSIVNMIRKDNTIEYPAKLLDLAAVYAQMEAAKLRQPLNSWLVYNGFNNRLYHSGGRLLPERREKVDRKVLQTVEKTLGL